MQLPQTSPRNDPVALWALQQNLLSIAEAALGARDTSKKIYRPGFTDDGPYIRNTPELDGAFAELSRHSESYWPTAVYEMAHETVHLLNPVAWQRQLPWRGRRSRVFGVRPDAIRLAASANRPRFIPTRLGARRSAPNARSKRQDKYAPRLAPSSQVTTQHLVDLFPDVDRETLSNLAAPFVRNAD